jgi:hypothetical protein
MGAAQKTDEPVGIGERAGRIFSGLCLMTVAFAFVPAMLLFLGHELVQTIAQLPGVFTTILSWL